jgi:hypothetical protein
VGGAIIYTFVFRKEVVVCAVVACEEEAAILPSPTSSALAEALLASSMG